MLSIRHAVRNDVDLLKALIHEMGVYERLPVVITEETLARDGFGPRPEFRVLIADWDDQPAGYASFSIAIRHFADVGYSSRIFLCDHNFGEGELATLCSRNLQPWLGRKSVLGSC